MSLLTIPKPCRWIRHPLSRQVVDSMSPQHKGTSDGVEVSDCDRQALLIYAGYKSKTSTRVGQPLNIIDLVYADEGRGESLFQHNNSHGKR